jgi:hypothetical protein
MATELDAFLFRRSWDAWAPGDKLGPCGWVSLQNMLKIIPSYGYLNGKHDDQQWCFRITEASFTEN